MSDFKPYKYRATGVGTFQIEGPDLDGCGLIWDHEVDAGRCVLAMNDAWRASRKHAVSYLEARSQHFRKYSLTHSLSEAARSRCAVQAQCLKSEAVAVARWDVLETETLRSPEPSEATEPRALCSDCGELHVVREDCPVERHDCGHDYVPKQPTETTPQVACRDAGDADTTIASATFAPARTP